MLWDLKSSYEGIVVESSNVIGRKESHQAKSRSKNDLMKSCAL